MLRRADRPARGRRGDLARLHGPHLRGPPDPRHPCGSSPTGRARGSPPPCARACTAPDEEAARRAPGAFRQSDPGRKYPQTAATWERAWERNTAFLAFPPALRRVIYTTNAIESLNYQLRKVTKNRGHFPSDEAAVKLLWLAICNIEDRRAAERAKEKNTPAHSRRAKGRLVEGQVTTNWKQALAQLAAAYPDRINPHL